jgi:alkaline phosphatase D
MTHRFLRRLDVDEFTRINRRRVLGSLGAGALVTAGSGLFSRSVWSQPAFSSNPFTLGVASGDPAPDGFVLWTKVAPKPLERGAGMPGKPVEVEWVVAGDEGMRQVVQKGKAIAHPEMGHSVHVELAGLEPARDYFYQFAVGGERSPVGRTRTFPRAGAPLAQLRFGVAGCQRYEAGLYTAYRRIAAEHFDFIYHYGDYIYEYRSVKPGALPYPVVRVMPGEPGECFTLEDYRHRYSLHQLDADLQAAHASTPFIMSFDDHEVANNWAGDVPDKPASREAFLLRRAAAFQAWYEHMPLRQFRSDQPCGDGNKANCAEALEPNRTMLGDKQEQWLYDSFGKAAARWTLLAQQVPLMRADRDPDPQVFAPNMDKWDGAVAARERLFAAVQAAKLRNLVVVDGDVHFNCAGELKKNFSDEKSATLGVEFVATSISSLGDGYDTNKRHAALMQQDPHIKFYNAQRGYVRHVVTPERWQADYQVLDKVTAPGGRMSTRRSFVVENGVSKLADA